jgi:uncharacterized FAD-dependent dehydrogenase
MDSYDCIIIGSGPAGLGAAFYLIEKKPNLKILILESGKTSSGGLRNDCKMNFTYPIGFPTDNWEKDEADYYLKKVINKLKPNILKKNNLSTYQFRAEKLGVDLVNIKQTHLGTDGGLLLIKKLIAELKELGVEISLEETMLSVDSIHKIIKTDKNDIGFKTLMIAPGRKGFRFIQSVMDSLDVNYMDHIIDIGNMLETIV